ncbi:hypothetical protein SLEP1_g6101 [Rubroshorea leprosula]|uniref:Uncharacterized protein n=1 Tax=Rubroshorea leprosula TaxID=152421 RepID=A0AAV5HU31_9ROSI|nr:hypothetical protein SLEP1_g6101 [Rubroshorea leprosula]
MVRTIISGFEAKNSGRGLSELRFICEGLILHPQARGCSGLILHP